MIGSCFELQPPRTQEFPHYYKQLALRPQFVNNIALPEKSFEPYRRKILSVYAIIPILRLTGRRFNSILERSKGHVYGFFNLVSIRLKDLACDTVGRSVS